MPNGKMRYNKGGDFNNLSTDILRAVLAEDLHHDPPERLSPETVKYIVKLIRKREDSDGMCESVDVPAAWEKFVEQYLPSSKEAPDPSISEGRAELCQNNAEQKNPRHTHRFSVTIGYFHLDGGFHLCNGVYWVQIGLASSLWWFTAVLRRPLRCHPVVAEIAVV